MRKNFMKSLTMWGLAALAGIGVVEASGAVPAGTGETLTSAAQGVAGLVALYGRWRASTPLTLGPG